MDRLTQPRLGVELTSSPSWPASSSPSACSPSASSAATAASNSGSSNTVAVWKIGHKFYIKLIIFYYYILP